MPFIDFTLLDGSKAIVDSSRIVAVTVNPSGSVNLHLEGELGLTLAGTQDETISRINGAPVVAAKKRGRPPKVKLLNGESTD